MQEQDYENQDSLNADEQDTTLDENGATGEDYSYEEDPQYQDSSAEERLAKLEEQNRRLYARLNKTKTKKEQPQGPKAEPEKPEPAPTFDPESLKSELREELRLEAQGYSDEEKEIILKASKALGIKPTEAAKDEIVAGKIARMREEIKTQNAIPSPSGKAGVKNTNTVDYYIEKGELPDDPELAEKVQNEIARRAKAGA